MILDYVKERDEVLLSLDKEKIVNFLNKYGTKVPTNETVFWAGIHKSICAIKSASAEQKLNSMIWLVKHGFRLEIFEYG